MSSEALEFESHSVIAKMKFSPAQKKCQQFFLGYLNKGMF